MESTSIRIKKEEYNVEKIKTFVPLRFKEKRTTLNNGKDAICLFNTSFRKFKGKSKSPWCLNITIGLDKKMCDENGLPFLEENFVSSQYEKELIVDLVKESNSAIHYLGHIYKEFCLEMYLYLDSPEDIYNFMEAKFNDKNTTRGFVFEIVKDSKWSLVNDYIDYLVLDETILKGKQAFPWLNKIFVEKTMV